MKVKVNNKRSNPVLKAVVNTKTGEVWFKGQSTHAVHGLDGNGFTWLSTFTQLFQALEYVGKDGTSVYEGDSITLTF